jgi:hypothetical protein
MDILLKNNTVKCFIIVKNNIVSDFWFANTLEEAILDNPNCIVEEITKTWTLHQKYK